MDDAGERRGGRGKEVEVHGWRYRKRGRMEWVGLSKPPKKIELEERPDSDQSS